MAKDEGWAWRLAKLANLPQAERPRPARVITFPKFCVGLLLLIAAIARAQGQDDPKELLLQLRQNVMETVKRLPKYVCTQTVDRTRYEPSNPEYASTNKSRPCDDTIAFANRPASRRLSSSDRLRLDVAVGHDLPGMNGEMYSWAGEDRFSGRNLFEFVRDGAISTGSFSSMLASIFGGETARFSYDGDSTIGGRLLSEFGFAIPQEKSHYMYVLRNGPNGEAAIAYDGKIFVDTETSDLVRLVVRTVQLPSETGACELTQVLDYGRVRLNGTDFLLPTEARALLIHTDGTQAENRIEYSACHEFRGESKVRFGPAGGGGGSASDREALPPAFELPQGLHFKVAFTDRIEPATAAAGDPIKAKLKTPIRDASNQVLVPEGTPIRARILKIRRFYEVSRSAMGGGGNTAAQQPSLVVDVKLEALDFGGTSHPIKAAFDSGRRRFVKQSGPLERRVEIGSLDRAADPHGDSEIGTFEFWETNPNYAVKSGFESSWVTIAP